MHQPDASTAAAPSASAKTAPGLPAPGAVTLFEVPFKSAMGEGDLSRLARVSDLSMRMHPPAQARHESPGLARLDHSSGLFLTRGVNEGEWKLQGLTWGSPTAASVHGWHVLAADAAHRLDPTVALPERQPLTGRMIPDVPLGRAANKRFARLRRRLTGLP
jgi:hypothetical protein